MKNNSVVFTDLDDTIFSTLRKHKTDSKEGFIVGSYDSKGEESGYLNPVQQEFFKNLNNMGKVIPVSARITNSLNRVAIFEKDCDAIWYHGAIIRFNGVIDKFWLQRSIKVLEEADFYFKKLMKELIERDKDSYFKISSSTYDDLKGNALQVLVRNQDNSILDDNKVSELLKDLPLEGVYCHKQRSYLTFLPIGLSKKEAVKYLIEKENFDMTVGCGDSDVDLGFMSLCDYAIIPKKSLLLEQINEEIKL